MWRHVAKIHVTVLRRTETKRTATVTPLRKSSANYFLTVLTLFSYTKIVILKFFYFFPAVIRAA